MVQVVLGVSDGWCVGGRGGGEAQKCLSSFSMSIGLQPLFHIKLKIADIFICNCRHRKLFPYASTDWDGDTVSRYS
jgi:hypothetical protein